jgi:flavin reductase (DIM6/NTAB) family NADH-FMN oxidoreductase RutF
MDEGKPALDRRAFRSTMGLFTTGVTVVAVHHAGQVHAMTANAVTSLSLDPPLIIFCVSRTAKMAAHLEAGQVFAINILRAEQQALSDYFAGRPRTNGIPRFEFERWEGTPRLQECAAALACRVEEQMPGGDHWIIVGRVLSTHQGTEPRQPLVFFGGKYARLAAEEAAAPDLADDVPVQIFYDPW